MASDKLELVQGDVLPNIDFRLAKKSNPTITYPIEASSTIELSIYHVPSEKSTNSKHNQCSWLNIDQSLARYTPQEGDFDEIGDYYGDAKVTTVAGKSQHAYNVLEIYVRPAY